MASRELRIVISGDSASFEKAMARAQASSAKAATGIEAAGKKMQAAGASMTRTGRTLTHSVTLPLVALGAVATKMSLDFNRSMSLISTQAGGTRKEVQHLSTAVLDFAKVSRYSPNELAQGLFHIESAGYRGAKAMGILREASKLSTVGNSEFESTTYALVSAVKALGVEGIAPTKKVAAELNAIVGNGDTKMEELSASLSSGVIPVAKQAGLGLRDVGAAIDVMTSRGIPAQVATTRLGMTISLLSAPSNKAKDALKGINIGSLQLAETMRHKGLGAAVKELAEHLQTVSKTEANKILGEAFGGGKSSGAIKLLVGNVGELNKKYGEIGKGVHKYNQEVKEAENTPMVRVEKAWSSIQVSLIEIGNNLIPIVVPAFETVANTIGDIGHAFASLPEGTKKLIIDAGLAVAAFGPLLSITGRITSGIGGMLRLAGGVGSLAKGLGGFASIFSTALKSGQGISSSFMIAGESAAPALMTGLTKVLPVVAAAAGIGSIIFSATKGDWKDAGFKAGGALIGGIAGFMAGGPLGAALGVGLGSLAGGLLGSLFSGTPKVKTMQERLKDSLEGTTKAIQAQKQAGHQLAQSQKNVASSHQHVREATEHEKKAQNELNEARRKSGPNSKEAIRKEVALAEARDDVTTATRKERNAERLHGEELKATKELQRVAILEERHRINVLKQEKVSLENKRQAEVAAGKEPQELQSINERYLKTVEALGKAQGQYSTSLKEAAQTGGNKWAHFLRNAGQSALDAGKNINVSLSDIKHPLHDSMLSFQNFAKSSKHNFGSAKGDVKSFEGATKGSLNRTGTTLNSFLSALGVKTVTFGPAAPTGKQRGGGLGGTGTGDTIPAMLEPGEYVLNRKAVQTVGTSTLDHLNFNLAPRFQKGGNVLGAEPQITGTNPLHQAGQHAVHKVYKAATRYYNQHAEPKRVLNMLHYGERETHKGYPYVFGGGHGTLGVGPFDCSGLVSGVLGAGNFISSPLAVAQGSGLYTLGKPGPGKFFTWGVRGTSGESAHALDVETPLLTVDGWKTMGTVVEGDRVYAEDGSPTLVTHVSEVFEDKPCYEVEFADGAKLVATGDHRWKVWDAVASTYKETGWRVLSTDELRENYTRTTADGYVRNRYRVAFDAVPQTPDADLAIEPYIFGYWLGDGNSHKPLITVGVEDHDHVVAEIGQAGYRITVDTAVKSEWGSGHQVAFVNDAPRGHTIPALLNELGVCGHQRKHIPACYLTASPQQRQALLAGLLDSDGCATKQPAVQFSSKRHELAHDVWLLARSLGHRASLWQTALGEWFVSWTPMSNPFRVERKRQKCDAGLEKRDSKKLSVDARGRRIGGRTERMSIVAIRSVPPRPSRCIAVAHPERVFLAGEAFTPTHNTMISVKKPGDKGWAFFEAGGSGGGAHEDSGWDGSFQFRHMPGFQKGGKIPDKAAEQIAKFGQAAFDPKSKHFVGWGFQKGGTVSGKVSWFNGGATAGGGNTSRPGIAMNLNPGTESGWDNPTTQGWMTASKAGHPVYAKVSISGHSANLPIIDLGPAGFTQRAIDVTEGGVKKLGFTTANFPTDATGTAVLGGGSGVAGKVSIPKGTSAHGGTSAGGATAKEIKRVTKLGAKHAKNPKVSTNVPTSVLPEWGAGLPRFQREELEGRGTTLPERETILGNAESNANFAEGIAGKALERAEAAYEENPTEANWIAVEEAATGVTQKRAGQSAASGARKLFEKGLIRHTTKQIKQINYQLAHSAGKLSANQIKALKEKRAGLVEQRSSARGEAQGASEALMGYEEESGNEAAERRRQHEEAERARPHEQAELNLARAEGTTGKSDDIKALEELRGVAEQELKYAESTGNLEDIADATRNLTQATENLKSLATAAFEEQAEGELALAELTEGLADDLAVLHNKLSFAEQRLTESEAEGNWAEIANWAHEVKGLTEAIKSDEGAESSAQLAEELKALRESIEQQTKFAEAATSTSSATAWKALADILSGNLGPRTIATSKTAGTGNIGTVSRL